MNSLKEKSKGILSRLEEIAEINGNNNSNSNGNVESNCTTDGNGDINGNSGVKIDITNKTKRTKVKRTYYIC